MVNTQLKILRVFGPTGAEVSSVLRGIRDDGCPGLRLLERDGEFAICVQVSAPNRAMAEQYCDKWAARLRAKFGDDVFAEGETSLAQATLDALLEKRKLLVAVDEHPYGHARYEYLAGLVVSVTILGIGFSLLKESVVKVFHPTPVAFSWLSVGVLAASILVKLWMSGFNRTIGRTIGSETLMATAADSRNDVLTTGAVLISTVVCSLTGWARLDGIMGVAVAAFILWSGWGLVMDTLSPLLGESPSPELVEHIEQTVMGYPGVLGMHDLMVHDYGPGHQFASLHIEFPAETDPLKAHDVIDNIENDFIKRDGLQVTIHYDPIVTTDAAVGVLRTRLMEKARQLDPCLSIHDLRIVPGDTHTNVLFDLEFPAGYTGNKDEMLAAMCQFVHEQDPKYSCVVKVEQSYASAAHEK